MSSTLGEGPVTTTLKLYELSSRYNHCALYFIALRAGTGEDSMTPGHRDQHQASLQALTKAWGLKRPVPAQRRFEGPPACSAGAPPRKETTRLPGTAKFTKCGRWQGDCSAGSRLTERATYYRGNVERDLPSAARGWPSNGGRVCRGKDNAGQPSGLRRSLTNTGFHHDPL